MTKFFPSEIWKWHDILLGNHAINPKTKLSECLGVNQRTDSYSYWWKPNTKSTLWCLGWLLAMVMLGLYSSSHMASDATQMSGRGSTSMDWESDSWGPNRTLHHATQVGETSVGCEKISVTKSLQASGCLIHEIANPMDYCAGHCWVRDQQNSVQHQRWSEDSHNGSIYQFKPGDH